MKIAILSDTHGLLRPEVMEVIENCNATIHAGDIDTREIMNRLFRKSPVYIVRGNNDGAWASDLPKILRFELEGLQFLVTHDKKDIPKEQSGVDVVVYGHSHKYSQQEMDGKLWINPGSCGKRRFSLPVTMAVMTANNGRYVVECIEFGHLKGKKAKLISQKMDLHSATIRIMKGINNGETVSEMAHKLYLSTELVEEICRMVVTHPGIDVEGVLNRLN